MSALAGCGLPAVDLVSVLSFSAGLVGCTFSARFVGLFDVLTWSRLSSLSIEAGGERGVI